MLTSKSCDFLSSFVDLNLGDSAIAGPSMCAIATSIAKVESTQAPPPNLPDMGQFAMTRKKMKWLYDVSISNWKAVQRAIENGIEADIANAADAQGRTALMWAGCANRLDVVLALRSVQGIQVDATDLEDNTALILAAYAGYDEITAALRDAAVNAVDMQGNTALLLAANKNCIDVVVSLLPASDINVNIANLWGLTALHCAALANHAEIVSLLLKAAHIDINAVDENGHTALMLAAAFGHVDIVDLLCIDPRININARDLEGQTALMLSRAYPEIADTLRRQPNVIINDMSRFTVWTRNMASLFCCTNSTLRKKTAPPEAIPLVIMNREQNDAEYRF